MSLIIFVLYSWYLESIFYTYYREVGAAFIFMEINDMSFPYIIKIILLIVISLQFILNCEGLKLLFLFRFLLWLEKRIKFSFLFRFSLRLQLIFMGGLKLPFLFRFSLWVENG